MYWGDQWASKVLDMIFQVVETVKMPKEIDAVWVSGLVQFYITDEMQTIKRSAVKFTARNQAWKKSDDAPQS